jgi:hypothetical protein
MTNIQLSADERTITVQIPLAFTRRGARKQVIAPGGQPNHSVRRNQRDHALVKALARAFRWQRMLNGGEYGSIADLASAEAVSASYIGRVLRLTLLAPDIVQSILDGTHEVRSIWSNLAAPVPAAWLYQRDCSAPYPTNLGCRP